MIALSSSSASPALSDVGPLLPVDDKSTVVPNPNDSTNASFNASSSPNSSNPSNATIMYTNRQIKEIESKLLYDYVHAMPYVDRKYFITMVVEKCDVPRRHFYNWQDGYSRIPTFAKKVIEGIVGYTMFESTIGM